MKVLSIFFCCIVLLSCQKFKETIQEDLAIKAMTDGQWRVTKFSQVSVDKSLDFAGYLFQFHANNTVDAIANGVTEKTGNWQADPVNRTITSTFTNAPPTLLLLNGTWNITKNGWNHVEANQTVNGNIYQLRLDK